MHEDEHRWCKLSRWGWGGFIFLLIYNLFMLSSHFVNHVELKHIVMVQNDVVALIENIEQLEAKVAILEPQVNGVVSYIAALGKELDKKVVPKKSWWRK